MALINQMVIDLSRCVGCGTCAIACKMGNNTPKRDNGQTFNWTDFITQTSGSFSRTNPSNTQWQAVPVKCNHCENPKCVEVCPVAPLTDTTCVGNKRKAMYKLNEANGGLVLHDDSRCIGCRRCQKNCPYSAVDLGSSNPNSQWSAISYNSSGSQGYWGTSNSLIYGCTSNPQDLAGETNAGADGEVCPANRTNWTAEGTGDQGLYGVTNIRKAGIVEKCYGCLHRVLASGTKLLPYCVQACPASARMLVSSVALNDDAGNTFTPVSYVAGVASRVISSVPDGVKVLARNTNRALGFANPYTSGVQPQTYYIGRFSKRL